MTEGPPPQVDAWGDVPAPRRRRSIPKVLAIAGGVSILLGFAACSIGPNPSGWGGPYAAWGMWLLFLGPLLLVAAIVGVALGAASEWVRRR